MFRVDDIVEQCIQTKSIGKYSRGKVIRVWLAYDPMQTKNAYEVEFTDPQGQKLYRLRYENEIVPLHSATPQAAPTPSTLSKPFVAFNKGDQVEIQDRSSKYFGLVGTIKDASVLPNTTVYEIDIRLYGAVTSTMVEQKFLIAFKPSVAPSMWAQSIDNLIPDKVTTIKKECKHEWKERTLFISVEEYCIHCPAFRLKKAV